MTVAESHVFNALRKVIRYLNLYSGAPYTVTDEGRLEINRFRKWAETLLTFAALGVEIHVQIYRTNRRTNSLYAMLSDAREILKIVFVLAYVFDLWRNHGKMVAIFEKIRELDGVFQLKKKHEERLRKCVKLWTIVLTVACASFIVLKHAKDDRYRASILLVPLTVRLYFQRTVSEILMAVFALLIKLYVEALHERIRELCRVPEGPITVKAAFPVYKSGGDGERKNSPETVDDLRNLFRRVHDLKNDINDAFSFRLWLLTVNSFTDIVFFCFANIVFFQYASETGLKMWFQMVLADAWLVLLLVKFILVINICHNASRNMENITTALYELRSCCCNQIVRDELMAFAEEVRARDPYFVALHLFRAHCPLISSMAQAIVMHIIILLQFQYSSTERGGHTISDLLSRT
ncbi:UNVERIFIED_CONTAM: hypothetical protein PYX00_005900 [Menopon gallinae]|uniref:Gustatory receptor n=1 Tax=Menopon gallinae TaxID=328185 RepID=A0AAW2HUI5_9NEOP